MSQPIFLTLNTRAVFLCLFMTAILVPPVFPCIEGQQIPTGLPPGIDLELPPSPGPGPGFLPRHSSPGFLQSLKNLAEIDAPAAAELLIRWISQRDGRLVFDSTLSNAEFPQSESHHSDSIAWIPPPEEQLQVWAKTLPDKFLRETLQNIPDLPLDGTHPWIWAPHLETAARTALELAVESGDRKTASILLRRPGLIDQTPPEWRMWIFDSGERPAEFRSTADSRSFQSPEKILPARSDWQVQSWNLQLPPTIPDPVRGNAIPTGIPRRSALARVHGLIKNDVLVLAEDRNIRAFMNDGSLLWQWSPSPNTYKADPHPPGQGTRVPVTSGSQALFLLRSPRLYQPPNTNLSIEEDSKKHLGWIEGHILDLKEIQEGPSDTWKIPIVEEGFSLAPTPLWIGSSLYLVATRGLQNVEVWIFAFDTDKRTELWRRKLETRKIEVFSLQDLRQALASSHLTLHQNVLSIDRSPGRVDRVCRFTGEHISVVLPPIQHLGDLPTSVQIRWGNRRLQLFPRPRPPAFPVTLTIPSSQMRLSIPRGSRSLLAMDLENGKPLWSLPVSQAESILGTSDKGEGVWLVDLSVPESGHSIGVRKITYDGKVVPESQKRISLAERKESPAPEESSQDAIAPILMADPIYTKGALLLATRSGLKAVSLETGEIRKSMPWPAESTGGWIFPWRLDGDGWGVIHRGQSLRGTESRLELWTPR